MDLNNLLDACRREVADIRLGYVDYTDFYDPETGEWLPTTCEDAIAKLERTIREIKDLMNHTCAWSADDYCIHCGADGRA